jgi:hypothetical protein
MSRIIVFPKTDNCIQRFLVQHTKIGQDMLDYLLMLDEVMEKWLGPDFDHGDVPKNSNPYRMLALLLDDPWDDALDRRGNYKRPFIVDVTKSRIQEKLRMLNGPHFHTVMKILELRMINENSERIIEGAENSSRPLV